MDEKIRLGGNQETPANENAKKIALENNIPESFIDNEFVQLTEDLELPSLGVFYQNGKKIVKIKCLTAEEDNILFSPELIKNGKTLDVLLDSIILDKDLRPDDMLAGDRNYVLIEARRTGFGDEYNPGVEINCEDCGGAWKPTVDLSRLNKKDLTIPPDSEGLYSLKLPMTKADIRFRLLRGSDEKRLSKIADSGQKKPGGMKVTKLITEKYLLQIMEVNGNKDKLYIQKFINHMPTKDSLLFRQYTRNIEPGIDLEYLFECPYCFHENRMDVPITTKLYYPDLD